MIHTIPGLTVFAAQTIVRQTDDCACDVSMIGWANNRTADARQDWMVQAIIQVPYVCGQVGS